MTTEKEVEMEGTTVENRSILVTGANRGIGQALVVTAVVVGVASLVLLGIWYDLQGHHDSCEE